MHLFEERAIFPFANTVLMWSIGLDKLALDARFLEQSIKGFQQELPTTVGSKESNF